MDMTAEQQAIEHCLNGQKDAFRPLVEAYFPRAVRLARAMVGNTEDARDLAQEAFIAAYRALPKMTPGRPFYPWLRGILLNRCRMFLRTRRRATMRRVAAAERPGHWAIGVADSYTPEKRRTADLVRRALKEMSPEDREILVLKHMEGYSYDELAAALGIGRGTVASRLYRARHRMQESLQVLDPTLMNHGEETDPRGIAEELV